MRSANTSNAVIDFEFQSAGLEPKNQAATWRISKKTFQFTQVGQGPPLILLGGQVSDWGDSIECLSRYFTVIVPSLSYGMITKQPFRDPMKYLELVVDELQLKDYAILTHSISAIDAFLFAVKRPFQVNTLIFLNMPFQEILDREGFHSLFKRLTKWRKHIPHQEATFWLGHFAEQVNRLEHLSSVGYQFPRDVYILDSEENACQNKVFLQKWGSILGNSLRQKVIKHGGLFLMKENPIYLSLLLKDFIRKPII